MSSNPVPDNLAAILDGFRRAQPSLDRLQVLVDDQLQPRDPAGNPRWSFEQSGKTAWPLDDYWSAFEAVPSSRYPGCHFDWGVQVIGEDRVEDIRFYAGVSCWPNDDNDPLTDPALRDRAGRRTDALTPHRPFREPGTFTDRTTHFALYRELSLADLSGKDSLSEQATVLAEFVDETFQILRDVAA